MIAERKILNKQKQKFIYSKESNYNFSGEKSSKYVSGSIKFFIIYMSI